MRTVLRALAASTLALALASCGVFSTDQSNRDPFSSDGLLDGNARPKLPQGDAGAVSVVQVGDLLEDKESGSARLLIAYRNNTDQSVSHVKWHAVLSHSEENSSGEKLSDLVAEGWSQYAVPAVVKPGGIGIASVYLPSYKDETVVNQREFTVDTSPEMNRPGMIVPARVVGVSRTGDTLTGTAVNELAGPMGGPLSVYFYCFDKDHLVNQGRTVQNFGRMSSGGEMGFTVKLGGVSCPSFVVGAEAFQR